MRSARAVVTGALLGACATPPRAVAPEARVAIPPAQAQAETEAEAEEQPAQPSSEPLLVRVTPFFPWCGQRARFVLEVENAGPAPRVVPLARDADRVWFLGDYFLAGASEPFGMAALGGPCERDCPEPITLSPLDSVATVLEVDFFAAPDQELELELTLKPTISGVEWPRRVQAFKLALKQDPGDACWRPPP